MRVYFFINVVIISSFSLCDMGLSLAEKEKEIKDRDEKMGTLGNELQEMRISYGAKQVEILGRDTTIQNLASRIQTLETEHHAKEQEMNSKISGGEDFLPIYFTSYSS